MSTILKRTLTHEVEIPLSGSDIADLFWNLDEVSQAQFFNKLGENERLVFQLQAVLGSGKLNNKGNAAMINIGDHAAFGT